MSGHSHWASIKHKKGVVDVKRGKIFSKLARAITVAARQGGGDPGMNLKLQYAIEKAKENNMPKDNIERAILKGTGELSGGELQECLYEGYGPSGVALMVEILTDNRNRTASEARKIFDKYGGNLGESGCVAWMFEKKGLFVINDTDIDEDSLMMLILEAGAEDMEKVENTYQVTCTPAGFESVKKELQKHNIEPTSAELSWIPKTFIDLDETSGKKIIKLMETLEDHDDVQAVHANFNLPHNLLVEMQT
ncbi:MAG: YebC/PmpR family DNA-binding transcriptional regulator [Candidatus Brocadiales bacterium]